MAAIQVEHFACCDSVKSFWLTVEMIRRLETGPIIIGGRPPQGTSSSSDADTFQRSMHCAEMTCEEHNEIKDLFDRNAKFCFFLQLLTACDIFQVPSHLFTLFFLTRGVHHIARDSDPKSRQPPVVPEWSFLGFHCLWWQSALAECPGIFGHVPPPSGCRQAPQGTPIPPFRLP